MFFLNTVCVGCISYADDIISLSSTVSGLQEMLNVCYESSCELRLQFNAEKSRCSKTTIDVNQRMLLGCDVLVWSHYIRYLGVHVLASKTISFHANPAERSFYAACNTILSHSSNLHELVLLRLHETYCLPILTYSIAAMDLKASSWQSSMWCVGNLCIDVCLGFTNGSP